MLDNSPTVEVVHVRCTSDWYCIDASKVIDVVPTSRVQWQDRPTSRTCGTVVIGQGVHAVHCLANQLGYLEPSQDEDDGQLLVLKSTAGELALLVDQVRGPQHPVIADVVPIPRLLKSSPHNVCEAAVIPHEEPSPRDEPSTATSESAMRLVLSAELLHAHIAGRSGGGHQAAGGTARSRDDEVSISNPQLGIELGKRRASLVVFRIHDQRACLALSVTQVIEVCPFRHVLRVPNAPRHILGLLNWRRQPAVVLDLAAALGMPTPGTLAPTRLMVSRVVSGESELVAFPIEVGAKVVPVPTRSRVAGAPAGCRADLLCGTYQMDGQQLVFPDMAGVLAAL
jgi:purine-binding chemotaxis protein CheW